MNDYYVYLIKLRGAGSSVKANKAEEHSLDEMLKVLEIFRKVLEHEKVAFIGHSTGLQSDCRHCDHTE
ncbi:hypothetical protein A1A1_14899 [Planococcus antarcticus DSM 14505]|uniref:Serine aminopeptidase S33 domain-containing protein n=1 Tax=Planococcus antarcticus DSM 14505 TaxID=1185653 RepID=A0A1C7DIL3_9BACL|nr:alpha/beta hydrolase [Planococcus antarcticus]ANU11063.1 hypothetical protein BBH88_12520 [Planococcus antarcticus DSM 14505]EIM05698.1 hypothetical protein A1A1_14899 [Planococcus antarcticus DSM 14505]